MVRLSPVTLANYTRPGCSNLNRAVGISDDSTITVTEPNVGADEEFLVAPGQGRAVSSALPIASNAVNCSIASGTFEKSSSALAFTITVLYFGITWIN
jgi:hypothetical protein